MPYKNIEDKRAAGRRSYNKRIEFFKTLLGEKCVKCGSTESLEFDHIDPSTKRFKITTTTKSLVSLLEELKKCQLLCYHCHKDKTGRTEHGSRAMYTHHKCRCPDCTEANRVYHFTRL